MKEKEKKERKKKRKKEEEEQRGPSSTRQDAPRQLHRLALPEMAVPLTLPVSGESVPPPSPLSESPSPPAPVWFVAASVVLVGVGLARYVHTRRRRCNLGLKGKFRL